MFSAGTYFNPFDIVNLPSSLVNFASGAAEVKERLMARKFAEAQSVCVQEETM